MTSNGVVRNIFGGIIFSTVIWIALGMNIASYAASPAQGMGDAEITPETHLGFVRADSFSSVETITQNMTANYHFPEFLDADHWALSGPWKFSADHITAESNKAILRLHFTASKVFLFLRSVDGKPKTATLILNGAPPGPHAGNDAVDGYLVVEQPMLYELINQKRATLGTLEIRVHTPGLEAYTFTFN